jgi:phospholipid/cholesterol/gamma-HCH transport system substrate-binding protein
VGAFTIQTRSIVSTADANGGILRGLAIGSPASAPAIFGKQNGVKALPAPGIDQGTTILQRAIPVGPGGQPPIPQDGSEPDRKSDQTPGEHESDDGGNGDLLPSGGGLLPGKKN